MSATTNESFADLAELHAALDGILRIEGDAVAVDDAVGLRGGLIDRLVYTAMFGDAEVKAASQWLVRAAAMRVGAFPASINNLYMAAGRGVYANATAPAMNIRGLTYDVMRTAIRAAQANNNKIFLFELARSETGYTAQRPGEYATCALAAAIKEGYQGPVFIQGDHYQINAKAYAKDPATEIEAIRSLTAEAIAAGYFNIDIDASTIVDLSLPTIYEQQTLNARNTAELSRMVRELQPAGVEVSIGGEIGEVGLRNSTVEDLRAFMDQYNEDLARLSNEAGKPLTGISKISVQTGTSHGGVILADGTIADVAVDFDVLADLSRVGREEYGIGGAVQHGASTLPATAFSRFAQASAIEVHLATAFQNQIFDSAAFPAGLKQEMYDYLAANHANERKPDFTDAQFYYAARKRGFGPFKQQMWDMPAEAKAGIMADLEPTFNLIMRELGVANSTDLVDGIVTPVEIALPAPDALRAAAAR